MRSEGLWCLFWCCYLCPSVYRTAIGCNGDAELPHRLGLGCCPDLSFSTGSLSHKQNHTRPRSFSCTVTPAYALFLVATCTHDTHALSTHKAFPISDGGDGKRSNYFWFLVGRLSADIFSLVWTRPNSAVYVCFWATPSVSEHNTFLWWCVCGMLVVTKQFSMHMCG